MEANLHVINFYYSSVDQDFDTKRHSSEDDSEYFVHP